MKELIEIFRQEMLKQLQEDCTTVEELDQIVKDYKKQHKKRIYGKAEVF